MKKVEYDNGNIVISDTTLYFYNINIGLEDIESVDVAPVPRRSIFKGIKEWFYGFIILFIVYAIWQNSPIITLVGDLYCYSFPILILFNIYMFLQKYYILIIRTKSGLEHTTKGKNEPVMKEIKKVINNAKEEERKNRNSGLTIENSIISTGSNNINKIENKRIYTNYIKIEEELEILLQHVKEKEIVKEAIKASKDKNSSKLKKCLSKLGKGTLTLIKKLGLIVLEKYIETYILK